MEQSQFNLLYFCAVCLSSLWGGLATAMHVAQHCKPKCLQGNCLQSNCFQGHCLQGNCRQSKISAANQSAANSTKQAACRQQPQHPQEQQQQPRARFEDIAGLNKSAVPAADDAEFQKLAQSVREAEQRATAAELAITTVQRAHTEAVEQSARLQERLVLMQITCRSYHVSLAFPSSAPMQVAVTQSYNPHANINV